MFEDKKVPAENSASTAAAPVAPFVDASAVAQRAVTSAKAAVSDDQVVKVRNHDGLSAIVFGDGTSARFHEGVARIKAKYLVQAVSQGCTIEADAPASKENGLTDALKIELEKVFGK